MMLVPLKLQLTDRKDTCVGPRLEVNLTVPPKAPLRGPVGRTPSHAHTPCYKGKLDISVRTAAAQKLSREVSFTCQGQNPGGSCPEHHLNCDVVSESSGRSGAFMAPTCVKLQPSPTKEGPGMFALPLCTHLKNADVDLIIWVRLAVG